VLKPIPDFLIPPMQFVLKRFLVPTFLLRPAAAFFSVWLTLAAGAFAGQFDAWQNSMKVTFNYGEWERLNNFPALIILNTSIPGFSYSQFKANGDDLRFEDANGVALAYEIEKWDTNGNSYVWVRIPELVGDATTTWRTNQWVWNWLHNGNPRSYGGQYAGVHYIETLEPLNGDVVERRFISAEALDGDGGMPRPDVTQFARLDPRPAAQGGQDWRYPNWANYTDGMLIGYTRDGNMPMYARYLNGILFGTKGSYDGEFVYADQLDYYYSIVNGVPWSTFQQGKNPENVIRWEGKRFQNFDPRNAGPGNQFYDLFVNWPGKNPKPKTWIRAYWGNSAAGVYPDSINGATWSGGNWGGVMHMNAATAIASRPLGLTPAVNGLQATAGKVAGALNFDSARSSSANYGAINWFNSGTSPNNYAYTLEAWVKRSSNGSGGPDVSYGSNSTGGSFSLGVNSSGNFRNVRNMPQDAAFSLTATAGQWQHVAIVTWPNNSTSRFAEQLYINGEFVRGREVNSAANLVSNGLLVFGREAWGSTYCGNVDLDEVRLSKVSRTYNWVKSSYETVANNNTFTTYGAVSNGVQAPTIWTAYNDLAWESGQLEAKITKYNPVPGETNSGILLDYASGNAIGVELAFTSTGNTPALAGFVSSALPANGSDGDTAFASRVDLQSRAYWSGGTVTMTVSGLSPTKRYSMVLYGARGNSGYTTRWADVKISDNSGFTNTSSAGSTIMTSTVANDTTRIITGDNAAGRVFRFDDINPGSDGDVVFTITGNGSETVYLNGVKISTYPAGSDTVVDTDGDGMSDDAEAKFGTNPNSPTSRVIVTATRNGSNQPVLGWPSVHGGQYRVEYRDAFGVGTDWQTLSTITASAASASATDTTIPAPTKRFYRIVAM